MGFGEKSGFSPIFSLTIVWRSGGYEPNNCIFMGFGEKSVFSPNFCPYYSMAIWRLWAKKFIDTILAEFGVLPSKNHDSIVFMQIC